MIAYVLLLTFTACVPLPLPLLSLSGCPSRPSSLPVRLSLSLFFPCSLPLPPPPLLPLPPLLSLSGCLSRPCSFPVLSPSPAVPPPPPPPLSLFSPCPDAPLPLLFLSLHHAPPHVGAGMAEMSMTRMARASWLAEISSPPLPSRPWRVPNTPPTFWLRYSLSGGHPRAPGEQRVAYKLVFTFGT